MNETWEEEPISPRPYGSAIFGSFHFGSIEWNTETAPTVTWSEETTNTTTWTEV